MRLAYVPVLITEAAQVCIASPHRWIDRYIVGHLNFTWINETRAVEMYVPVPITDAVQVCIASPDE